MTYQDIEVHQVTDFLQQGPVTIFDVRDLNSFNEAHMDNAVPATDFAIEQLIVKRLKHQPVLAYCYMGNSSRDFCSLLGKMGFTSVYNLVGGFTAWNKFIRQQGAPHENTPLSRWLSDNDFDTNNVNDRIDNGNTPLMLAAMQGNADMLQALLAKDADVSLHNQDINNALWFACVGENPDVLRVLLTTSINIDHQNVNGATCLVYAASAGKYEMVKQLINAGANPHIKTLDGFSALESAATLPILKFLKPLVTSESTFV